ncbi:MAG: phosphoglycerate mutase, partial [Chthonomonadales bacterium]
MKYILVVPDGMADDPLEELDGRTPLEAARTPRMDYLAEHGTVGMVRVTPESIYPGSDAANMSLLGYDPLEYYTGRGPVEAAAMEVPMDDHDVAFRCSLVSSNGSVITDYSAGHVDTAVSRSLIELSKKLLNRAQKFYPGISYRHIMTWTDGPIDVLTHAPHENMDRSIQEILPTGDGESFLRGLIWDSLELLNDHPYNRQRIGDGLSPANMLWPWGQGRK